MRLSAKTCRPVFTAPAVKVAVLSILIYGLAYAFCIRTYWRDPKSHFYDPTHVYDLQYTAARQDQASVYIDLAKHATTAYKKAGRDVQICAAFVTMQREGTNYINKAIGSVLEGLTDEEREKLFLYILFANTDPTKHESWQEGWIKNTVDAAESYNVTSEKMEQLKKLEAEKLWQEKGIFDYLYALDACYNTGAPYIAMFEDDIILADGWMVKTLKGLRDVARYSKKPGDKFWNWIYMRLFFTETFRTWEVEYDFWWRNLRWAFAASSLLTLGILMLTRTLAPSSKRHLDPLTMAFLCLITIPAFVDLRFKIGKYALIAPRGVEVMNYFGCCSQALVFPRARVPELAVFLRERNAGQTDTIIEDYSEMKHLTRLALAPQVAQHVGTVSSRGYGGSQAIFAFWFEAQKVGALRREHDRLIRWMKSADKKKGRGG